ncbi:hypothetical protein T11_2436, partial [Trichinella zimbabwensis]
LDQISGSLVQVVHCQNIKTVEIGKGFQLKGLESSVVSDQ